MKSITDGFNEIKDNHFGLTGCGIGKSPHFRHIRVLKELCENPPATDGAVLADALLARIEQNWRAGRDKRETAPSGENWRFCKAGKMDPNNPSPEVTFERDFIEVAGDDWANQVPTSSGLLGPAADGRRAIDLVERKGEGVFEFVELKIKIDDDTPLRAALEVLDLGNAENQGYRRDSNSHTAPRCTARAKRTGLPCRAPAVRGWCVCRMHGARGGAPRGAGHGNFRHGARTREAVEARKAVNALVRLFRETIE